MLIRWFFAHKSLPNLLFGVLCLPGDQSHPVCATDNKPSCVLQKKKKKEIRTRAMAVTMERRGWIQELLGAV